MPLPTIVGLGVPGDAAPRFLSLAKPPPPVPGPSGEGVPELYLRIVLPFIFPLLFCHSGLEKGVSLLRGLALRDRGVPYNPPLPAGETLRGVGDSAYRGGVIYCVPGVGGGVVFGSRPSRERCVGVRGMSARSSLGRMRGRRAKEML